MAAPHPPPCKSDEQIWPPDGLCYPKIASLHVLSHGDGFSFLLGKVSPNLLPQLALTAGDKAHLLVKKKGRTVDVTITSVPHKDASELLKQLRPHEPDAKLPD